MSGVGAAFVRMSPARLLVWIGSALVVGVCVAGVVVTQLFQGGTPAAAPVPSRSSFDAAGLASYWSTFTSSPNADGADWAAIADVPKRDDYGLTVGTRLYPRVESRQVAVDMCTVLVEHYSDLAVRVLDRNGDVLVSRHSDSGQCVWRR